MINLLNRTYILVLFQTKKMTTESEEAIRLLATKCKVPYRFVEFIAHVEDERDMLEEKIHFLKNAVRYGGLSCEFISEVEAQSLSLIHKIPIHVVKMVLATEKKFSASALSRKQRFFFLDKVLKHLMCLVNHILPQSKKKKKRTQTLEIFFISLFITYIVSSLQ